MSRQDRLPSSDDPIKNLIQDAFGMSAEECLKEFQDAQARPDTSPELKAPPNGFQCIKDRIELEGILSAEEQRKRKIIRLRKIWRPMIAVALVGSMLWIFGIGAMGKKFYGFRPNKVEDARNNIIWDNDDNLIAVEAEEEAYQAVKTQLNIDALRLMWKPFDMKFVDLHAYKDSAVLVYTYEDHQIYFVQMKSDVSSSTNYILDRTKEEPVYNELLGKTIMVTINITEDGNREYQGIVEINGAIYYLYGIFEEKDTFFKIVKDLNFYNKERK